ncbi:hypothetical protein [Belliella aquatica]|uniref:Uncharacterized protein n=1 Tax=Belliella aquatica TaxID=1323734 RepID=A0ABQ1N5N2_9BACT|nr:hypothetical protein [Belliella aquatica]MCH7407501.1 hypothetical protein [Belliella aquatica]GGC54115.1 hypothetical protein GCM10010993_35640 [Belliella aquatica]
MNERLKLLTPESNADALLLPKQMMKFGQELKLEVVSAINVYLIAVPVTLIQNKKQPLTAALRWQ